MKKLSKLLLISAFSVVALAGCDTSGKGSNTNNGDQPGQNDGQVTSITLSSSSLSFDLNGDKTAKTITATVEATGTASTAITWTQSNPNVVTLMDYDDSAMIIPKAVGQTVITAKAGDKTATCTVSVTENPIAVTSISLNKTTLQIGIDATFKLEASILPQNATNKKVNWSSSNACVSVDGEGNVKGVSAGNAIVKATTEDGNKEATCAVEVLDLSNKVVITVENGTGGGIYDIGEEVTITADKKSYPFKEFQVNDVYLSLRETYTFNATVDMNIKAVYDTNPLAKYTNRLIKGEGEFKILNFADVQLHNGDTIDLTKHILDTLIEQEHPDMFTVLGDLLNDSTRYATDRIADKLVELFDSYDIPWAPVFGNHDQEDYTPEGTMKNVTTGQMAEKFAACENCLFILGPEEVEGKSNYMVNIMDETTGKPAESLIFLDSRGHGLQDTHVAFYENCVNYVTELNGGEVVRSVVFDHIPLPQLLEQYKKSEKLEYRDAFGDGCVKDPLSAGTENMFPKMKELGSTKIFMSGHDHENSFYYVMDGIKMGYAMKSSEGDDVDGCSYKYPMGGALITLFDGEERIEYKRVTDIEYTLKSGKDFAYHNQLNYWRYTDATLVADIKLPQAGTVKFNIEGTNMLRTSTEYKYRVGLWNRLTANDTINASTKTCDYGTLTPIEGEEGYYRYAVNVADFPLNTGAEKAIGDETAFLNYFHSPTADFVIRNVHYEIPEVTETNQVDLSDAVISEPSIQFGDGIVPRKPEVTVTLDGTTLDPVEDILIQYDNNYDAGEATLRVVPSGKGAHKYKGYKEITFTIYDESENPDTDKLPGHENAKTVDEAYTTEDLTNPVPNWHGSGYSVHFEVKPLEYGAVSSGNTCRFALYGKVPGDWIRLTKYYILDFSSHTVYLTGSSSKTVGTFVEAETKDGWWDVDIPLASFEVNTGESLGNEDFKFIYFEKGTHSFKFDKFTAYSSGEPVNPDNPPEEQEAIRGQFMSSGRFGDIYCYPYTVSEGGILTIDYKYVDPVTNADAGVSMYIGTDFNHCFGSIKFFHNHLDKTYNGVTFTTLDDGYNRIAIDLSVYNTVFENGGTGQAPTAIEKVMFKWFEASEGVYIDVNSDGIGKELSFTMTGDNFKIANFTDIHLENPGDLAEGCDVRKTITYAMQNSQPDAVCFPGDFAGSVAHLDDLLTFMDSFKVPYFFIFGNHDRENKSATELASHIWKSEYGFIDLGPTSLQSQGNYVVKINNTDGDLVHAIVLMDTRANVSSVDASKIVYAENPVEGVHYGTVSGRKVYTVPEWDGIRDKQLPWYEETVTELGCETTLICHAPMLQYCMAFEKYQKAVNESDQTTIDSLAPVGPQIQGEACCGLVEDTGFFSMMKRLGSTKNVICGHDHVNTFSLLYEGIRLTYAMKVGDGAYGGIVSQGQQSGYTMLNINAQGNGSIQQIYYDYR